MTITNYPCSTIVKFIVLRYIYMYDHFLWKFCHGLSNNYTIMYQFDEKSLMYLDGGLNFLNQAFKMFLGHISTSFKIPKVEDVTQ
jgi:hypothetical protein